MKKDWSHQPVLYPDTSTSPFYFKSPNTATKLRSVWLLKSKKLERAACCRARNWEAKRFLFLINGGPPTKMKKMPDFIVIPTQIIHHKQLQPIDRIVYGFIYWLEKLKDGKCTASNRTLAELSQCTERSIRASLERLEKAGFITRIYLDEEKKRRKQIVSRVVYGVSSFDDTGVGTNEPTVGTNEPTRVGTNEPQNNKSPLKNKSRSISSDASVAGVEDMMKIFNEINPTLNWGNVTIRRAAADLIKRFGLEGALGMARQVVAAQGQRYAPTATTPYQMKEKLAQFVIYFKRQSNNKPKVGIVS